MLYVENIDIDVGSTKREISDDVRQHVTQMQIKVIDAHVLFNKFRQDRCGCKITVPTRDIDIVLADDFWPQGISCRLWEERKRNRQSQFRDQWSDHHTDDHRAYRNNDGYGYDNEQRDDYEYSRAY